VSVLPGEEQQYRLLVRATPINNFFSKTQFNVTKYGTTDIPTIIETEFTDLTKTRIDEFFGTALSILKIPVPAAPVGSPPPSAGVPLCSTDLKKPVSSIIDRYYIKIIEEEPCWDAKIERRNDNQDKLIDTLPRDLYIKLILHDKKLQAPVWPITVCQDVTLVVTRSGVPYLTVPLTIIDPVRVRLVGLPEKGKITMRPLCSADVTNTPSDKYGTIFDAMAAADAGFISARDQWRKIK
jgi:hypothetical protein